MPLRIVINFMVLWSNSLSSSIIVIIIIIIILIVIIVIIIIIIIINFSYFVFIFEEALKIVFAIRNFKLTVSFYETSYSDSRHDTSAQLLHLQKYSH